MPAARLENRASQRGFTLIEIMVVVVIIGLLAAIVAPNIIGRIDQAAANRAKTDIRQIETALQLYRLDNFKYPSTDEGLEALVTKPSDVSAPNWNPRGYMQKVPNDPWERPYLYRSPGQQGEIDIYTLGADGQEGGEGVDADVGNWNID